jgi:hypothetical protein
MTVWGGVVKLFLTVEVLFGQLCKGLAADTGVSGLGTSTCLVLIECLGDTITYIYTVMYNM